ncbi:hypothetical protein [Pontixanthobacter aquaemixtae]|uniref:Uncharacterized protein n=1 Tax=Pontixanthobacter aquaemixtae TaxID=1958940 RepID=A0A844ZYF2_9SPHN|nr:hypothetical protein [Pontixanthobacter aquaemixtae]MXO91767.1 hypothetical protein [Pontixanthobacter aquaemixtae]
MNDLKQDQEQTGVMVADLREDYFSVFHALAPQLGKLEPDEATQIVRFYMLCKSAKDSIMPDGVMVENEDHDLALENALQLLTLMTEALRLGDQIAQWIPQIAPLRTTK